MKRFILLLLALFSVPALGQQTKVPEIPFASVTDFLKLPADLYLGEVSGVARNSKGHIFIYTRSGVTRLLEFDATGKFLHEIGRGLYAFSGNSE